MTKRSYVCRFGGLGLGLLVLAGCCCSPGNKAEAEKVYCRSYPAMGKKAIKLWPLLKVSERDFVSPYGTDFEITHDFKGSTAPLSIDKGDRIIFAENGIPLSLAHYASNGTDVKARVEKLTLHDRGYWASGVVKNGQGDKVGTYFVYRTTDRAPCEHSEPINADRCREFHFEYFATDDVPHEQPDFNTNIKEATDGMCSGGRETDEGDGDEGRRRR